MVATVAVAIDWARFLGLKISRTSAAPEVFRAQAVFEKKHRVLHATVSTKNTSNTFPGPYTSEFLGQ